MSFAKFRQDHGEQDPELDQLTEAAIGALIEVHKVLGPGLTENLYEEALCHELTLRGLRFERQVLVNVIYKGKSIGQNRIDLIVEGRLIIELKSCEELNPVHRAQLTCYLRLEKLTVGLLVNFNVPILVDGLKRVVLSK